MRDFAPICKQPRGGGPRTKAKRNRLRKRAEELKLEPDGPQRDDYKKDADDEGTLEPGWL